MCAVCDGLERCCGVSAVCGISVELGVHEVSRVLVIFECSELTRSSTVTHVCDCGVTWKLVVLGGQQLRAGAKAFC